MLSELKVCIAIKEKVLKDSGVPNETFFDNVVTNLLTKPLAVGKFHWDVLSSEKFELNA